MIRSKGRVDTADGYTVIQWYVKRLENRADRDLLKLSTGKW